MCGIYGSTISYSNNQIKEKLKRASFRGPDQLKYNNYKISNGSLTLGHNRLSIIDLDPRSNQPFSFEHVHIVFNGEIYNFKELKTQLEKKGYKFRTSSDTEVVCVAYLEFGIDCVKYFNGMFAFVIYDERIEELFGATDRLGQKPFYYYHNKAHFEFSSQLISIQIHNKDLSISKAAIDNYFAWNYIPAEYSIFNEIKKLPQATRFNFNLNSGKFSTEKYWSIDYTNPQNLNWHYDSAKEELSDLLGHATKIRLFADVPVGVFLSGGIDSSLISALATRSTNEKINTFSIKFNESGFDESTFAEKVAKRLETNHETILCNESEGLELIENFTYYFDEPFADASAIPSMLLAKHTRKKVTVALSGDGADEAFLGYHRYDWLRVINYFMKMPLPLRRLVAEVFTNTPNYRFKIIARIINSKSIEEAYIKTVCAQKPKYLKEETVRSILASEYLLHDYKSIHQKAGDFDLMTYLPWDINTKVDRATMAFSLEARSPFLDYRVIEFAQSLPTDFKYKKGYQKRILRDILMDYFPKSLFERPKSGFTMPFKEWFKNELKPMVYDTLTIDNLSQMPSVNSGYVISAINDHMNSKSNNYSLIWKLLVLQQWLNNNGKGYSIK